MNCTIITHADGSGDQDMTGATLAQARAELLDQCADDRKITLNGTETSASGELYEWSVKICVDSV